MLATFNRIGLVGDMLEALAAEHQAGHDGENEVLLCKKYGPRRPRLRSAAAGRPGPPLLLARGRGGEERAVCAGSVAGRLGRLRGSVRPRLLALA